MAKKSDPKGGYPYPSRFGSHQSMVSQEATEQLNVPGRVVCVDEFGSYETDANRLDTSLADPNRYATNRLEKLLGKTKEKDEAKTKVAA